MSLRIFCDLMGFTNMTLSLQNHGSVVEDTLQVFRVFQHHKKDFSTENHKTKLEKKRKDNKQLMK